MRTDAGRGRLYDALKVLRGKWADTEPLWNDPVRMEFEEKTLEPLFRLAEEALRAIDRLNQVFVQARRECSGDEGFGSLGS